MKIAIPPNAMAAHAKGIGRPDLHHCATATPKRNSIVIVFDRKKMLAFVGCGKMA